METGKPPADGGGPAPPPRHPPRSRGAPPPPIRGATALTSWGALAALAAVGASVLFRLATAPAPVSTMLHEHPPRGWAAESAAQLASAAAAAAARALVPPAQTVAEDAFGYARSMALYAACALRLGDAVGEGGKGVADLAAGTGAHAPSLGRLLRALAAWGYFRVDAGGGWWHTRLSALLAGAHPHGLCAVSRHLVEDSWEPWRRLPDALRDPGFAAFPATTGGGADLWAFYAGNATRRAQFDAAMAATDALSLPAVVADYPWGGHRGGNHTRRVVDVGGARGSLLRGLLAAHPHLRGVLFDLPDVIAAARSQWAAWGASGGADRAAVAARVEFAAGSFLPPHAGGLPPAADGDVWVARTVLHDWDDAAAAGILRSLHAAMGGARATLALVEQVVAPSPGGDPVRMRGLIDLHMRVITGGGRERTADEWRGVLREGGFALRRVVPTRSLLSVIEAVPV